LLNIIFTKSQNWIKTVSSWKKTAKGLLPAGRAKAAAWESKNGAVR
jgi:hypothetical protein